MAMLVLPEVFERTWGQRAPLFWPTATQRVRERVPGFLFMAEVYWDMEWTLQQQGFDYAYDKRLYDRLREGHARPVREHFHAGLDYQDKLARFLENHDEPRAAATFSPEVHQAAAVITFLSPGLRFFHQGQFEGRKKRISPHLVRGPNEPVDENAEAVLRPPAGGASSTGRSRWPMAIAGMHSRLGRELDERLLPGFRLARSQAENALVVAVNYAPNQSQCHVRLPFADLAGKKWQLQDQLSPASYEWNGDDLQRTRAVPGYGSLAGLCIFPEAAMSGTSTESRQVASPPRVVAISGIVFSVLYIASLMLIRLAVPADPTEPGVWLVDPPSGMGSASH